MRVNLQPYNPTWPRTFAAIRSSLESLLRAHSVPFLAIEHVGSTSVPGLAAKPIIDIDVVVTASALPLAIAALTTTSSSNSTTTTTTVPPLSTTLTPPASAPIVAELYTYLGERGIPGRHALREPGLDDGDDEGGAGARHTRNVYVCVEGCLALRNHLAVRDTLRRDEAVRREYEAVKVAAARREWESVEGYVEAKSEVLGKILRASGGFEEEEVGEVRGVNARGGGGVKGERGGEGEGEEGGMDGG